MNAFEIPGLRISLDAKEALDWRRFIKVNADGQAEYATADTDAIVGISYTEAPAGTPVSIVCDGVAMVEAGEDIDAGAFVTAGAEGKAAAGGDKFIALTGAATGSLITVKMY